MKKTKTQKGITLVALIITIIVLLILAVVTINAVKGDGIIQKAERAKDSYTQEQRKEQDQLLKYEYEIAKAQGTVTGSFDEFLYNKAKEEAEKAGTEIGTYDEFMLEKKYGLKIGDKVNYKPNGATVSADLGNSGDGYVGLVSKEFTTEEDLTWRILGINDDGEIELFSTVMDEKIAIPGDGLTDGVISSANTLCNTLYGKDGISTARAMNADDINKLSNYTPTKTTILYKTEGPDDSGNYDVYFSEDNGINWKKDGVSSWDIGSDSCTYLEYTYNLADRITNSNLLKGLTDSSYCLMSKMNYFNGFNEYCMWVDVCSGCAKIDATNKTIGYFGNTEFITAPSPIDVNIRVVVTLSSDVEFGEYNETTGWEIK